LARRPREAGSEARPRSQALVPEEPRARVDEFPLACGSTAAEWDGAPWRCDQPADPDLDRIATVACLFLKTPGKSGRSRTDDPSERLRAGARGIGLSHRLLLGATDLWSRSTSR
jgi:hypothetical protein